MMTSIRNINSIIKIDDEYVFTANFISFKPVADGVDIKVGTRKIEIKEGIDEFIRNLTSPDCIGLHTR